MEAIKEKEIEQTEPPKIPESVQILLRKIGLEEFHAQLVIGGLEVAKVDEVATRLTAKKALVVVDDEGDATGMAVADTLRKEAKETRCALEKNRKELKEIPLKQGQLIDGIAKHYKELIVPLEDYFEAQATFAKRAQEKRTIQLITHRKALLENEGMSTAFIEFGSMPEEEFAALHQSAIEERKRREAKAEQEKKLANERTDLLRAEGVDTQYLPLGTMSEDDFQNRLSTAMQAKADKAEAERKAAEAKAEADRQKAIADQARAEQAKADAAAKAEEARLKKIADEAQSALLAKQQQEEAERIAKAEEARKLAEGPEIERVRAFAKTLRAVAESAPVLRSQRLNEEVDNAVQAINTMAEELEMLCDA